ncbi:MAG: SH3 domain-containing protein [Formivibrio sp.]|nr:SH3 domain-containing protein [Formivibrio sp.]
MKLKPLFTILLFASTLALAESGSVSRSSELKDKPFLDAATVTRLSAGSIIDIKTRKGAWAQVSTRDGKTGWLKILNIRSAGGSSGNGMGGVNELFNVAKTGSSGNTVTTGVKGLSAEQIKNAKPNPREVERMQSYGVSSQEAQRFARSTGLQSQKVPDIRLSGTTSQQNSGSD